MSKKTLANIPIERHRIVLDAALRTIRAGALCAFEGKGAVLALTYHRSARASIPIPDYPVRLDTLRMHILRRSGRDGGRDIRRRPVLEIRRPVFDPVTGRVLWTCSRSYDLLRDRPDGLIALGNDRPATRSTFLMIEALTDAAEDDVVPASQMRRPRLLLASRGEEPPVYDERLALDGWEPATGRIHDELWGRSAASHDRQSPPRFQIGAREAPGVYVDLRSLRGRVIRNPSLGVLENHGLIPESRQEPEGAGAESDRLRERLHYFAATDPAFVTGLLAELRYSCLALGIPIPTGLRGLGILLGLLESPWRSIEDSRAAVIQVVRLAGGSAFGQSVLSVGSIDFILDGMGDLARGRDRPRREPSRRQQLEVKGAALSKGPFKIKFQLSIDLYQFSSCVWRGLIG